MTIASDLPCPPSERPAALRVRKGCEDEARRAVVPSDVQASLVEIFRGKKKP